jgi:hypothetical protein
VREAPIFAPCRCHLFRAKFVFGKGKAFAEEKYAELMKILPAGILSRRQSGKIAAILKIVA